LKYWTARSWRCAAARLLNVPRLRRLPVLGLGFLIYFIQLRTDEGAQRKRVVLVW